MGEYIEVTIAGEDFRTKANGNLQFDTLQVKKGDSWFTVRSRVLRDVFWARYMACFYDKSCGW